MAIIKSADHVGIWGAGVAGTLCTRAAKAYGTVVTIIDPDPVRATRIGGVLFVDDNHYFDIVLIAAGNEQAYQEAFLYCKPRGRVVIFSGLPIKNSKQMIDLNDVHYRELTISGAYGCCYHHSKEALYHLGK